MPTRVLVGGGSALRPPHLRDAAGLGALVAALRHFGDGGRPQLLDPAPLVRKVIELTGAGPHLELATSVGDPR